MATCYKLFLYLSLWSLVSCSEDSSTLSLTYLGSANQLTFDELTCIDGQVIGVGGDTWSLGVAFTYDIVSQSFQIDTLSGKRIFGLEKNSTGIVAAGLDGYVYTRENSRWENHKLSEWGVLRDIISIDEGYIAVGGKSFVDGYIYHLDSLFQVTDVYLLEQEASSVASCQQGYIVSTYGGLHQFNGQSWEPMSITGDFYTDIEIVDNKGLIVGSNGSVLISSDCGEQWTSLIDPNQLLSGNTSWNVISYDILNQQWLVGGDEGHLLSIHESTHEMVDYQVDDAFDIKAMTVKDNIVYIGNHNGQLAMTTLQ